MAMANVAVCPQQHFGAVPTNALIGIIERAGIISVTPRAGGRHCAINVIAIKPPDHHLETPILRLVHQTRYALGLFMCDELRFASFNAAWVYDQPI